MKRLNLGMVGGGQGAFIGAVHRIASRIDDRWSLVAGALSSDPNRARTSAQELGLDPARSYGSFEEMAQAEAKRPDGIDAVAIVTPNHLHAAPAIAFLKAGIHVICDKPLAATKEQAHAIAKAAETSNAHFILTHNYSGYPLIRLAKEMVARGDLGQIRMIQTEYAQDWLSEAVENTGLKQATWRTDPNMAGAGALGDIGTHAYHLLRFVSGCHLNALSAEVSTFVAGRKVDDNALVTLRFDSGARGAIWVSQVAVGCENSLRLRIYGDKGGLEWAQENPNQMYFTAQREAKQIITRGGAGFGTLSAPWTRTPPGHPEGYLEGFAMLYSDIADFIHGTIDGALLPNIDDGLEGMWFINACLESAKKNGAWVSKSPQ